MPDSPDWSKYLPGSVRFSLQDMSELAVRLGAFDISDRRGEVLYQYGFDYGLGIWTPTYTGVSSGYSIVAGKGAYHPYSVLVSSGAAIGDIAEISAALGAWVFGRIGLEAILSVYGSWATLDYIIDFSDGSNEYEAHISIDCYNNILYLYDDTGAKINVATTPSIEFASAVYNAIKLVCDFSKQAYVRCIIAGDEFDLSKYSFQNVGATGLRNMNIYIRSSAQNNSVLNLLVDGVIVTSNEP